MHANSPKDGFWKHEWEKHGTCAMQLPQMDSELKFFEEGVALNGRFPLQKYLSDADITPGTQTGLIIIIFISFQHRIITVRKVLCITCIHCTVHKQKYNLM